MSEFLEKSFCFPGSKFYPSPRQSFSRVDKQEMMSPHSGRFRAVGSINETIYDNL